MKPEFEALGHTGSGTFVGLETFPNPGCSLVTMNSDEFTAVCPITGQPDLYEVTISYQDTGRCIESKSMKLYLGQFRNEGMFVESLAVRIKEDVTKALEGGDTPSGAFISEDQVKVTLIQKRRGGIEIRATA